MLAVLVIVAGDIAATEAAKAWFHSEMGSRAGQSVRSFGDKTARILVFF